MSDKLIAERHALSLVKNNEDMTNFGLSGLWFALNRYHDRKTVDEVVQKLLNNGTITNFNGRVFLTEDDDDE